MYVLSVQRYIYSKVGQVVLAEDLTSEVFLRALRWLEQDRSTASICGWLYATTRTVIADHWRGQGGAVVLPLTFACDLCAEDRATEDEVATRETRRQVQRLLHLLPERDRSVLRLRYLRSYAAAEIAQELGLSPSYVRVIQFRALQQAAAREAGERTMVMDQEGPVYSDGLRQVLARADEEARGLKAKPAASISAMISAASCSPMAIRGVDGAERRRGISLLPSGWLRERAVAVVQFGQELTGGQVCHTQLMEAVSDSFEFL